MTIHATNEQAVVAAKTNISKLKKLYVSSLTEYYSLCESASKKQLLAQLLVVQQAANEYFNYVDEFVGNSDLLGAHKNGNWVTSFAEDCAEVLKTLVIHFQVLRGIYENLEPDMLKSIEPGKTSYASIHRLVKEYLPKDNSKEVLELLVENKLPIFGFENEAAQMDENVPLWQLISGLVVGVIALILVTIAAIFIPNPSTWQMFIFRGVFAISLSAIAAIIPGFVNVKSRFGSKNSYFGVVAGGAIAIFVLVWIVNPPALIISVK